MVKYNPKINLHSNIYYWVKKLFFEINFKKIKLDINLK